MAKILILIGGHLCTAPRPQKEAAAFAAAGHEVTVCGLWFDAALATRDRKLAKQQPYRFDIALDFRPGQSELTRLQVRMQHRLAREGFQYFGVFSPALLGYGAKALLKTAHRAQAELTIVHSEAGLWIGKQLIQKGHTVGVDFEDWFSRDLLPSALKTRPTGQIQQLEKYLMQRCAFRLTTSQAMANALSAAYNAAPPQVIYNVFPRADGVEPKSSERPAPLKLHWYSQTIGPGRGLETLFSAIPFLNEAVEIHLRGNYPPSSQAWMEPLIPNEWRSRVIVHPLVSNAELPLRIAENDIGLALEMSTCDSRHYTATNKLFQYMQAGLAVIASDTAGQREIMKQVPNIGILMSGNSPAELAAAINQYNQNRAQLQQAKQAAYRASQQTFCYETQVPALLSTLNQALSASPQLHEIECSQTH